MGHDASISVIKNNKLIYASSVERHSKIKKDHYLSRQVFDDVLECLDISLDDIDCIAMGYWNKGTAPFISLYSPEDQPYPINTFGTYNQASKILNHLEGVDKVEFVKGKGYTLPYTVDRMNYPFSSFSQNFRYSFMLNVEIEGYNRIIPGHFVDHHMSHASSTYFTSPYNESAIFTVDASMHHQSSCSGMFLGKDNKIDIFRYPGYMMGNFYDSSTEWLGIGPGTIKAGTLMGLSSYGKISKKARDNWEEWTTPMWKRNQPEEDHAYQQWLFSQITGRFPYIRERRKEIVNNEPDAHHFTREWQEPFTKEESTTQEVMDYAADIQYITERSLVKYSQDLYKESKNFNGGNLCVAGGS